MTIRFLSAAISTALFACAVGLPAQTPAPAPLPTPQPAPTPAAASEAPTHTITLDVVAAHKSQPPVAGLASSAFTLRDNKTPRPITSFKTFSGDNTPVSMILVIDDVNTDYSTIGEARIQIDTFLKANQGHLTHPTKLAIFTDTGMVIQPSYTRDGKALAESLDKQTIGLRDIRRSSGFYGADERTELSLTTLARLAQNELKSPGRKLVLWISPGWPLLSGIRVDLDDKQAGEIFRQAVEFSALFRQAHVTLTASIPSAPANRSGVPWITPNTSKASASPVRPSSAISPSRCWPFRLADRPSPDRTTSAA
jgi:hypothetical protein